jgi:hypothetical protein
MRVPDSPKRSIFRDFIVGLLAGAAGIFVALVIGLIINLLFPSEDPAYFGIGFDARNLPGTILGLLTFVGIILIFANPFRQN